MGLELADDDLRLADAFEQRGAALQALLRPTRRSSPGSVRSRSMRAVAMTPASRASLKRLRCPLFTAGSRS